MDLQHGDPEGTQPPDRYCYSLDPAHPGPCISRLSKGLPL